MNRRLTLPVLTLATAVALTGCSDAGAASNGSSSGSASGSLAHAEPAGHVPAGVAAQYATLHEEIEAEGGQQTSGEWTIGYIIEPAEPWHAGTGDAHTFREPAADETHHIEIIPTETSTGRIVPDVPIHVAVVDQDNRVVDERDLAFLYGEFFHYATNFAVPRAGRYTLRVTLQAPDFLRHGAAGEQPALAAGASVEFTDVALAPEQ